MLDTALQMDPVEREARAEGRDAHRQVLEAFAYFIAELKSTATKREEDFVCVGFGLSKFRLVGMGAGFKHSTPAIRSTGSSELRRAVPRLGRYHRARLVGWILRPAGFDGLSLQNVLDALAALCADPNRHVMILSAAKGEGARRLARCPTCRSPSSTASTTA